MNIQNVNDISYILHIIVMVLSLISLGLKSFFYFRKVKKERKSYEFCTSWKKSQTIFAHIGFDLAFALNGIGIGLFFVQGNGLVFALILLFSILLHILSNLMTTGLWFEYEAIDKDKVIISRVGSKKVIPIKKISYFNNDGRFLSIYNKEGKLLFKVSVITEGLKQFIDRIQKKIDEEPQDDSNEIPENLKKSGAMRIDALITNPTNQRLSEEYGPNMTKTIQIVGKDLKSHLFSWVILPNLLIYIFVALFLSYAILIEYVVNRKTAAVADFAFVLAIICIGLIFTLVRLYSLTKKNDNEIALSYATSHPKVKGHANAIKKTFRIIVIVDLIYVSLYSLYTIGSRLIETPVAKEKLVEANGNTSYLKKVGNYTYIGIEGNESIEYLFVHEFTGTLPNEIYDDSLIGKETKLLVSEKTENVYSNYLEKSIDTYYVYAIDIDGKNYFSYEDYVQYIEDGYKQAKFGIALYSINLVVDVVLLVFLVLWAKNKQADETYEIASKKVHWKDTLATE